MSKVFFPIEAQERGKLFLLLGLAFLTCFNYTLLRCLQDTLVITGTGAGAAVIPCLKLWFVLPVQIGFAALLAFLFRRVSFVRVFGGLLIVYAVFFILFGFLIYPHLEALCLKGLGNGPLGAAVRCWPLTLFYLSSELWKSAILMTLFWGLANRLTPLEQGKRFYGLLMVGGSLGSVAAGGLVTGLTGRGSLAWESQLALFMGAAMGVAVSIFLLLRWVKLPPIQEKGSDRPKQKVLLSLAVLLVADYLTFTLIEVLWKEQLWLHYPNPQDFCHYLGWVMGLTSLLAALCSLLLTGPLIRRVGWTAAALAGPSLLLLTGGAFFVSLTFGSAAVVTIGALHNGLSRACRHAMSDPARELAYIPLSVDQQTAGKAYVDGVSPTLGRTGASLLQQVALIGRSSLTAGWPLLAGMVGAAWLFWTGAVFSLRVRGRELLGSERGG